MSVTKIGCILFSSFLIFATAPFAPAQQNSTSTQDTNKKQTTTKKGTASKDQSTTATQSTTTGQSKSDQSTTTTDKTKSQKSKSTAKKGTVSKEKKTSSVSRDKVRETQTALKKEGFDPGPIDGILGPMTMTALRNYQSHNHLEVTGTITDETHNALMSGATASTAPRSGQTDLSQTQPLNQPYRSDEFNNQDQTAQGVVTDLESVKKIQQDLDDLGYTPGEINGMMSSNTRDAIRQFQWWNDLPVTGNLDEQTKSAIETQERGGTESAQLGQTTTLQNPGRAKPGMTTEPRQTYNEPAGKSDKHEHHGKSDKDAEERLSKSAAVLQDLTSASDQKIPDQLLEHAEAIAVIPNMIKGAFGIGGRYGKGVVAERNDKGHWSTPAFSEIGGGSFGAQLGFSSTDLVLVFTDRKALDLLEKGKDLKLGVDAGVTAGPIGRTAEAGVNANLSSAIYAYSRSKGLFAGVALDGAVLNMDKSMNEKVYGNTVDARQILSGTTAMNSTVRPFMDALNSAVPAKRISQK
jgi:lipid-binding SYLF domain-containing protein/peptidoglycan hydrolase-like protein with peptidoglycan-binding domain